MNTEESSWESKLIFDLNGAKLLPTDVLHVILFIFQYFPIYHAVKGTPGEQYFLKNKWIFTLSDLKYVTIETSIHFLIFFFNLNHI